MNGTGSLLPTFGARPWALLRAMIAAIVIGSLGLEILPGVAVEPSSSAAGRSGGRALCLATLQVCDHGDAFLGVLFDCAGLPPGANVLLRCPERPCALPDVAVLAADGFHPPVDHPPQLPS